MESDKTNSPTTIVCAWCNKILHQGDKDNPEISHGICLECSELIEYSEVSLDKILIDSGVPVLLVDKEGLVQNANSSALDMLQKREDEIKNRLGGVVMRCVYSELPEGCGNTDHCSGCTIRNSVMETFESEMGIHKREAFQLIRTPEGPKKIKFIINTKKVLNYVLLSIESMEVVEE